jgi:hypothetical protein
MATTDSNKRIHEPEAMLAPAQAIEVENVIGCLEKRYMPLVQG